MLTTKPTMEMIEEWKCVYAMYRSALKPNRKPGYVVDKYFREKYSYRMYYDVAFQEAAFLNIIENDYSKEKLPDNKLPDIRCYKTGDVFVAIDLCTGEFHIESENTEEVIRIYDDLFLYRGLDENDLKNFFLVAEYIRLSQSLR